MSCPRKDERWKKYHVPKSGAGVLQIARFTDSILISFAERRLLQLSTRSFEPLKQRGSLMINGAWHDGISFSFPLCFKSQEETMPTILYFQAVHSFHIYTI